jgi:hypothetical protein
LGFLLAWPGPKTCPGIGTGYTQSKMYISAMIQPVPKSKKEQKSISRQVNLAILSPPATIEYLQ